jgi:hypothetical protein
MRGLLEIDLASVGVVLVVIIVINNIKQRIYSALQLNIAPIVGRVIE